MQEFLSARYMHLVLRTKGIDCSADWPRLDRDFNYSAADLGRHRPKRRPGDIGTEEEYQHDQRHECFRSIFGQIMRDECADPGECESGVGPFFELGKARNDESDGTQRLGDAENYPYLLRISHIHKSFTHLLISRYLTT